MTYLSLLFGACILGLVTMGWIGFLGGVCLMFFGWFYAPIIFIGYIMLVWLWRRLGETSRVPICIGGSLAGATLFAVIGIKEEGSILRFTFGYFLGAALPAFLSLWFLTRKENAPEPHGGVERPATVAAGRRSP